MTQENVPLLSICIPTHDGRGGTLQDALRSFFGQFKESHKGRVDVCISDNASEDETQALVAQYSERYPGVIRYQRNPVNLGFSRNLMNVIGMSSARFCWLLSSDDALVPHALARALETLAQYPTLTGLTCNWQTCDRSLTQPLAEEQSPTLRPKEQERLHRYSAPEQIFRECGSVMGYTSAQIFDRALWQECLREISPKKFSSFAYFPYLYLFGKMVQKKPQWIWLPEKLVLSRTKNDYLSSHLSSNMLKYHRLTMEEASQVWGQLFGRSSATYQSLMRDNYINFWCGPALLRYKALTFCTSAEEWRALLWFSRRLYFLPSFWLVAFPILLTPHPLARGAAALARKMRMLNALRAVKRRLFPV